MLFRKIFVGNKFWLFSSVVSFGLWGLYKVFGVIKVLLVVGMNVSCFKVLWKLLFIVVNCGSFFKIDNIILFCIFGVILCRWLKIFYL